MNNTMRDLILESLKGKYFQSNVNPIDIADFTDKAYYEPEANENLNRIKA